ncbi:MAG: mechanosensitive ion channel family protein [Acidobacteriaceae bacterium]
MWASPRKFCALVATALAFALMAWAGVDGQANAPNPVPPNTAAQVLGHVNLVLQWFRQWSNAEAYLAVPGDELYVQNGQDIARKVVKLEFQSALAEAALIGQASPSKPAPQDANAPNVMDAENILKLQQSVAKKLQTLNAQLETLNAKIPKARTRDRADLISQRDTLQGQIELAQALEDNLQQLSSFMNSAESANGAATELTAKIRAMQRTVPTAAPVGKAAEKSAAKATAAAAQIQLPTIGGARNEGLVGQIGDMIHLVSSLHALDQLKSQTARLQASTQQLRAPLLLQLRSTLQRGQIELQNIGNASNGAAQPGNVTAQPGSGNQGGSAAATGSAASPTHQAEGNNTAQTPEQQQHATARLVQHFRQLSDATLPLSQELILIDQSQANLRQLQDSVEHEYGGILRSLLLRVVTLLIALGLIWLFSELWRRATFRYVRDARRRRQFLVLRRVITGFCMFVVVLLGFVSDFSSLATYAGLITAGVAVALQTVILSIAAYFFLVGRYGVRVGDRVTVVFNGANSVTGDVVDIGLVRFYLMELIASGIELKPTGRIVVFPNSVLFQTSPLYKQFPGTEYMWREIGLPMRADSDVQLAEKEMLSAVNALYADYEPMMERQHAGLEETLGVHLDVPKPYTRVRLIASGLEVVVNYPIPLRQAAALDERIVMAVMEILRKNPAIRLTDGTAPELRSTVKV